MKSVRMNVLAASCGVVAMVAGLGCQSGSGVSETAPAEGNKAKMEQTAPKAREANAGDEGLVRAATGAEPQAAPVAAPAAASAQAVAAAKTAPVNTACPIGGHDVDNAITVSYQGKTIAFCCDDCKQEFLGMDEKGKAAILAKATGK